MEFCILECRRFVAPDPGGAVKRIVRNHEFDFYMDGARTVTFDGRVYPVSAGSLCVRRPGQVCSGVGDYDCYQLTVIFGKRRRKTISGKSRLKSRFAEKTRLLTGCRRSLRRCTARRYRICLKHCVKSRSELQHRRSFWQANCFF